MKKGFTLVELLAVIILLEIIAFIAVPVLLKTIKNSEKNSIKISAQNYVSGLSKKILSKDLVSDFNPNFCIVKNGELVCDGTSVKYETEGKKPTSGVISVSDGEIVGYSLCIDDYKVVKNLDGVKAEKDSNCEAYRIKKVSPSESDTHKGIVYFDPTDISKFCKEDLANANLNDNSPKRATGVTNGCMKFYIYDDEGDSYKLILDHNTSGNVPWNSSGSNLKMGEVLERLLIDTKGWAGNPRLISANEVANIIGVDSLLLWSQNKPYGTQKESQSSWYYLDGSGTVYSGWQTQTANSQNKSSYAWLYDNMAACSGYGCVLQDDGVYPYPNLDSTSKMGVYGYWTSDAVFGTTGAVWRVLRYGYFSSNNVKNNYDCGVRPVITLPKYLFE